MSSLLKLRPEVKALWLEALRSGKYEQARGSLRKIVDGTTRGHCCLGVLCDVHQKTAGTKGVWKEDEYIGSTGTPPNEVMLWAFENFDPEAAQADSVLTAVVVVERTDTTPRIFLTNRNDGQGWDFHQIADEIEDKL